MMKGRGEGGNMSATRLHKKSEERKKRRPSSGRCLDVHVEDPEKTLLLESGVNGGARARISHHLSSVCISTCICSG
jgi:hypothetical protein